MRKKHKITGNSDSAVTADNVHFTNIKLIISPCLIWEGGSLRLCLCHMSVHFTVCVSLVCIALHDYAVHVLLKHKCTVIYDMIQYMIYMTQYVIYMTQYNAMLI